jgi:phasin family protein
MSQPSDLLIDWMRTISSLDATKGVEPVFDFLAGLKVPGVDMDALVASQRGNLGALTESNQAILDGAKLVGQWQVKILQETMQQLSESFAGLAQVASPRELMTAETELAQKALATALGQMRELAQIMTDANKQAAEVIARRVPESLEEIKDILKAPQWPTDGGK